MDDVVAQALRDRQERSRGYRERALALFPAICAHCGREFSGKNLRMLTVHHKDHDHDNNPPDGSNWELLCTYCHDHEHSRGLDAAERGSSRPDVDRRAHSTYQPFAGLDRLLVHNDEDEP